METKEVSSPGLASALKQLRTLQRDAVAVPTGALTYECVYANTISTCLDYSVTALAGPGPAKDTLRGGVKTVF